MVREAVPGGSASPALPRELPPTSAPAVAVLAGTAEVSSAPLDLAQLARLLYLSAGVVRTMERPYGTHPFRAAGSAGGPVPARGVRRGASRGPRPRVCTGMTPGTTRWSKSDPRPGSGGPAVVVTGVPWRTGWRYRERGYRHIYWDACTMLAQLLALADSAGLNAALYSSFPDAQVAALVGADRVHEFPVAVVGLSGTDPAADHGRAGRPGRGRGRVDAAPLEFPLVTAAQRAGRR